MKHQVIVGMVTAGMFFSLCSFNYIEKYYGKSSTYQEGTSVVPLSGGGYLLSGAYDRTGDPNDWNSYLLMLNEQGDTVWTKRNLPQNGKVKPTLDNNFIFVGGNNASQAYDTIYITKADIQGNVIWRRQVFFQVCHNTVSDILALPGGGYLVTGFYASQSCMNPTYDSFILKLDENGNIVWQQFVIGFMDEELNVLKALPDGNFAAFGWSNSANEVNFPQYLLVKFDPNGNIIWKQYYGSYVYGYGLEVLPDGGFVMLGYDTSMQMIKADSNGTAYRQKTFGLTCGSTYFKVSSTTDGGLAILGSEEVNGACTTTFMKTDLDGNILWKKNWNARLREFRENANGSFVLTGYANYLPQVAVILMDTIKFQKKTEIIPTDAITDQKPVNSLVQAMNQTAGIDNTIAEQPDKAIKVYPNPASEKLCIEFYNPNNSDYRLEIYTITGQMVQYTEHITAARIELSGQEMPKGVYAYKLSGDHNTYIGKFVFQ